MQWYVLLDSQVKDRLLPGLRCIGVFSNVLTRNGVFSDLKMRQHVGRMSDGRVGKQPTHETSRELGEMSLILADGSDGWKA